MNTDLYEFGSYRLDVRRRVVTHGEQVVRLPPKTFDLLLLLLRSPERAFSKQELMTALWPDTFVEEANLSFQVSTLRKALGDVGARWIETVPKHGYRFAGQVNPGATAEPARSGGVSPSETPVRRSASRNAWLAAIVAAALIIGAYMTLISRSAPTARSAVPTRAAPLTSYEGVEIGPSLSPDGSQVAFAWNGPSQDNFDIWIKLVGPGEPIQLTRNPARDYTPAWSPDGKQIAFQRITSQMSADVFVIPALGGAERKVASISVLGEGWLTTSILGPAFASNLAWSPDGRWLAFGGGRSADSARGIWLIDVESAQTRQLTAATEHATGDWGPAFSPDGRYLAFIREAALSESAVYILPLTADLKPAGAPIRITRESGMVRGVAWTPDGRGLVFSSGGHLAMSRLYRLAVPSTDRPHDAEPELLPFGEQSISVSISKTGRLVYSAQSRDASIWSIALNSGKDSPVPTPVVPSTFDEQTPAYSPNGNRLAFASTRSGVEEIWVANADGSNPAQITSMGGPQCANPQWSPVDGQTILFNSRRESSTDLYLIRPDGSDLRQITNDPAETNEPRWSRDGRTIYFGSNKTGRFEVWKMPVAGGPAVQVTKQGGTTATESLDGQFLYYAKSYDSPSAIWRVPVGGGEEKLIVEGLSYSLNFVVAERGLYFLAIGDAPKKGSSPL